MQDSIEQFEQEQLDKAVELVMKAIRESGVDLSKLHERMKKSNDKLEAKIKASKRAA